MFQGAFFSILLTLFFNLTSDIYILALEYISPVAYIFDVDVIEPFMPLVFEVELLSIEK